MTDPLLRAALVGTAREPLAPAPAPLEAFALAAGSPEERLLLLAGARAVMRRAGLRPRRKDAPEPAPAEALPPCSVRAGQLLSELFATANAPLLREAAAVLARARQRLRPELLPDALAVPDGGLREALLPALGARGAWLARLRPDWTWATGAGPAPVSPGETKQLWEEGAFPERLALLAGLRSREPAGALALIDSTWKKEKAEHRSKIVEALAADLGPGDEAFLEAALDDRSAAVRGAAAPLLARLPGSALSRRMEERAGPLIARAAGPVGLLGKLKALAGGALAVEVSLPSALDAAWERDGVERKPPQGVGARISWLGQTLSLVRPAYWEQRLSAAPGEIAAALRAQEEAPDLLDGFTQAALLFRDPRWAAALWDAWYATAAPEEGRARRLAGAALRGLLPLLSPEEASARVERLLAKPHDALAAGDALGALPVPWSDGLSRLIAHAARAASSSAEKVARILGPLQLAARSVAPSAFDVLDAAVASPPPESAPYVERALAQARETLRLRRILHQEIHP